MAGYFLARAALPELSIALAEGRSSVDKILVIDDDSALRATIRDILNAAGYQVLEAANGVSGLDLYRQHQPSLVITDILMPEKDGIEAVRELRHINPQVRIIAMSGGTSSKTFFLPAVLEFGAEASLQKPFRRDELLTTVATVLNRV